MTFSDSIVFAAALLVIVGSGVLLGYVLRGRSLARQSRDDSSSSELTNRLVELYSEIIGSLDDLSGPNEQRKQWFIHRYYLALVAAPDEVVLAVNRYLDSVTQAGLTGDQRMAARANVVAVMRRDIMNRQGRRSAVSSEQLYRIELKNPSASKPDPAATKAAK